jgi:hypothetical protein
VGWKLVLELPTFTPAKKPRSACADTVLAHKAKTTQAARKTLLLTMSSGLPLEPDALTAS